MDKSTDEEFEELPPGWLTRNLYKGVRVTSCEQILELAKRRESVWVSHWGRTSPAAFLANWQAARLIVLLTRYELFTVIKRTA